MFELGKFLLLYGSFLAGGVAVVTVEYLLGVGGSYPTIGNLIIIPVGILLVAAYFTRRGGSISAPSPGGANYDVEASQRRDDLREDYTGRRKSRTRPATLAALAAALTLILFAAALRAVFGIP